MILELAKATEIEPEIKGAHSKVLLADPVFAEAVAKHRDELTRIWARSEPADQAAREAAYFEMRALGEVVRALESFVRDARHEQHRRERAS